MLRKMLYVLHTSKTQNADPAHFGLCPFGNTAAATAPSKSTPIITAKHAVGGDPGVTESTEFRNTVDCNVRIGSLTAQSGMALVTLRLHHEIRKLAPTIKKHLMRHLGRNSYDVAGRQFLPHSALNLSVALFMRRNRFAIDISPANQQRRGARLHEENITLRLMPFDLPVGFSVDLEDRFVRKIGELFHRRMVGILRRLAGERLDHRLQ